jgi:hypothetical protein
MQNLDLLLLGDGVIMESDKRHLFVCVFFLVLKKEFEEED